jgi:hypothetical protein
LAAVSVLLGFAVHVRSVDDDRDSFEAVMRVREASGRCILRGL